MVVETGRGMMITEPSSRGDGGGANGGGGRGGVDNGGGDGQVKAMAERCQW